MELDLSNLAMTGSYTITMDSNASSSMEGQAGSELKDHQTQGGQDKAAQNQVEGHGEGEGQGPGQGQGKVQGDVSDEVLGQVQLGAQDSLEECMAQLHHSGIKWRVNQLWSAM